MNNNDDQAAGRANILVVDDTRANLRLLSGILSEQDYLVRPVPDGQLALSAVKAEAPDLILLDIMMPGLSGYEVCKQLKEDKLTRDIPVIFISAKNEIMDKVKAFSLGGVDYITKPFQTEEVVARVRTHLTLRQLQTSLEEKNRTLSETLEELKTAQNQLVLREKMAALGQLIAGIAHEINTPLGAIRASISNILNALSSSICQLPELFQQLSPERQTDFFLLIKAALEKVELPSSKKARKLRRILRKDLEKQGVEEPDTIASTLVNMGIWENIPDFISLLREENNTFILQTAYNLFVQQNNSRNIVIAVDRASKIVLALKHYTRHDDSGRMMGASVSDGIDVVLTLYHNRLKRGIDIIREYEETPEILCYPDELNQVWTNLIHNSVYAMNGSGELRITVSEKDGQVLVRISDSGTGIPENIRHRIFEPFFTTKPPGEGSGLGLDIVRKIIERHHGKIDVESSPGRTTFSVFLPILTEPSENDDVMRNA
ncbi:MAG: hybrid sensor histidine kinase/response regulator [Desulfobacteraceae bacterium 4572_88]|nr:MAG: hybrid sensor histidine kinase/response regulator [Desulfobacteraceae bacterium 4572_88]